MSKYYTPTPAEFGLDFEFQYLRNEVWYNEVITFFEEAHEWVNSTSDLRVKYLDREDIESLGFEDVSDDPNTIKFRLDDIDIYTRNWKIFGITYHKNLSFNGTVKNKSEFKRILTQIGYNK